MGNWISRRVVTKKDYLLNASSGLQRRLMRWSLMEKRRQNLEKAVELWLSLVDVIFMLSLSLAKFYEHRLRDYDQAMYWTRRRSIISLRQNSCP
jgi:hypothetical protein